MYIYVYTWMHNSPFFSIYHIQYSMSSISSCIYIATYPSFFSELVAWLTRTVIFILKFPLIYLFPYP